ncbi:Uu.00g045960.m01.CDS01 [Anthostomella pinea]|uniref:Carboxylic ester hydrolase n=1 Tax=Anthostomella pinea TaxID=933095 RepID=A0AAI8V675_9PEZI|nr:Uu.00g045960.m01.CDS01 [Anthostomella pinea]
MTRRARLSGLLLSALATTVYGANDTKTFQERCLSFKPDIYVQNSTLNVLEYVPSATNLTFPDNDPTCARASQMAYADLCRVALSIPTSNRSSITFEMWLPESWEGRTLATGNGGIDGCVKYEDIAYGTANGFSRFVTLLCDRSSSLCNPLNLATMIRALTDLQYKLIVAALGTNNGHNGTYGNAFYHNEDIVIDYAWVSLHTSVDVGKRLTTLFYGESAKKSYYIGCSLGGRQGIGSAEKFPEDFDGIVAGSPAVNFNSLYSWRARFFTVTGAPASEDFIAADTWKTTIHSEVLSQCDGIDGVLDGIIEDPTLCHFQAERLLCGSTDNTTADCLNPAQVQKVETIFSNYLWPNGTVMYPGMQPGSEILAADGLYSGQAFGPSTDWFRFAVLEDPSWRPATYTLDDSLIAAQKNLGGIRTWPSSLAAFQSHGGKLLTFHGQQDQQISSFNSARFYGHLASGMGYSQEQMDEFYRLFRVPGMNHCSGGPGAWTIGQGGSDAAYGIPFDRAHNVLAAVVDWVEGGLPPDTITGTKFVNDSVSWGVAYQHRHCRYPSRSTYKGEGHDPLIEDSWECRDAVVG